MLQTYVDSLKKSNGFDKTAQIEAFTKAKELALSQLTEDIKKYITANFGVLDNWLSIQIESCINSLKKV